MDRRALLALANEAARDPSASRAVLADMSAMLAEGLAAGRFSCPPGYLYAPGNSWTALFEGVHVEPLPVPGTQSMPLTSTTNAPFNIKTPFDSLIVAVCGWAIPSLPVPPVTQPVRAGAALLSTSQDGRDLFSVRWGVEGITNFSTDGDSELMEPATNMLGSRRFPRALGWKVPRNKTIQVFVRNLTNLIVTAAFAEGQGPGMDLTIGVTFFPVNLEAS